MTDPRRSPSASADALTADDLVAATGGALVQRSARPIRGAAVDSREILDGQLFVALPGERTDGHRFVGAAVAAGAAAVLAREDVTDSLGAADVTVVRVADTLRALQATAAAWRLRFSPIVVGITGSIAKTSTKEATAAVLGVRYRTLKNEGNLNNEIGLPVTVLRLAPEHEAAVLEMGMYVGGEIRDLAAIGRPRIGVVTAVQPVHLSRIGTIDAVEAAKGELVEALPTASEGGVAVLNADDERVTRMDRRTRAATVRYGFTPSADVRAEEVVSAGTGGMAFTLVAGAGRRGVRIPALGRLSVHNALAAAAVATAAGLSMDDIEAGLEAGWSAPHRGVIVPAGGVTIVDDSYNASPGSVRASLELLAGLPGRRVAVLGEMLELGDAADEGHRAVGVVAAEVCDLVVVVDGEAGGGAAGIVSGAAGAGMPRDRIVAVADRSAALTALLDRLEPGDVVLVKASRGIALDLLVDDLVAALEGGMSAQREVPA